MKKELEIPVLEVLDDKAYLEGGDVLFTGEFYVLQKKIITYKHTMHVLFNLYNKEYYIHICILI